MNEGSRKFLIIFLLLKLNYILSIPARPAVPAEASLAKKKCENIAECAGWERPKGVEGYERIKSINYRSPRVSIITSVYKGDKFIRPFLEDIVRQTIFKESELILINANSPDNEEPVIKEFMLRHKNIVYVKLKADPGLYGVWNIAIKISKSNLLTNANLDDRKPIDSLEKLVTEIEKNPSIDLIYSDFYTTYTPNQVFDNCHFTSVSELPEFSIKDMVLCLPGPCPVWRKNFHNRFGYFNEKYKALGDWEMWLRAVSRGSKFKKLNKVTCLYYYNPEGLSTSQSGNKYRDAELSEIHRIYKNLWR